MYHCFFSELTDHSTQISINDPLELHHMINVLHQSQGESISLFNGKGLKATGEIISVKKKKSITVQITHFQHTEEFKPSIILACAIPKKGRMDLIIEKCTELGVSQIFPLITERTEVLPKKQQLQNKTHRFEAIALSAAKQSRQSWIPKIHPPTSLNDYFNLLLPETKRIIPSLENIAQPIENSLSLISSPKIIHVLIGPEGDFTPNEYQQAYQYQFKPVKLGSSILRVETAAIATISFIHLYYNR